MPMQEVRVNNSMSILESMLAITAFRRKVLSSNIANADTPGYRARDISFQGELDRALKGGRPSFDIFETPSTMQNRDGNTVNLDIEMTKVAENSLIFNTATQIMATKIRMYKDALRGGR
jgi:flagellar basal-body rod protein FlgB